MPLGPKSRCAILSQKYNTLCADYGGAEDACDEAEGEAKLAALRKFAELKVARLLAKVAARDASQQLEAAEDAIRAKEGAGSDGFGGNPSDLMKACKSFTAAPKQ